MPEQEIPAQIVTLCNMLGINPPRLITRDDIDKAYPDQPTVQGIIWAQVESYQGNTEVDH